MRRVLLASAGVLLASACLSTAEVSGGVAPPAPATCSADLKTEVGNCGRCGFVCPGRANAYAVCTDGTCAIACNTGFDDCDKKQENGCESSLDSDPKNCGACGHSCLDARCVDGQCQAYSIAVVDADLSRLFYSNGFLYFASNGGADNQSIARMPSDGRAAPQVLTGLATSAARDLITDDTHVYWATPNTVTPGDSGAPLTGQISRALKDGTSVAAEVVAGALATTTDSTDSSRVQIRKGYVYWLEPENPPLAGVVGPGNGARCKIGDCVKESFGPDGGVFRLQALAVDDARVYFGGVGAPTAGNPGHGLFSAPTAAGVRVGETTLMQGAPVENIFAIAQDDAYVYFATNNAIGRVKKSGGEYNKLADTTVPVREMLTDGVKVYWLENLALRFCPVAGCGADTPVVVQLQGRSISLAHDPQAVFVAVAFAGSTLVQRVAK